jgi:2-desacetyl-2-hydroxyethyl bacteriochlorophyllide A dehydrogenase
MQSLNIIFPEKNRVEVREEEIPSLGDGQILVETRKSLISTGTECTCLKGDFAPGTVWDDWVQYPFAPGYCVAGRVLETAGDVTQFQSGDRVALRTPHRQYHVCRASKAFHIPDGVSDEEAVWFTMACSAQNGVRRAAHELGDVSVVIGLGLLGQLVVQYLRCSGAREVIAVDTSEKRLEMAAAHGATHTLALPVAEAAGEVERITRGRLADVVYDITGHPAVFAPALGLARTFGKLVLLGDAGTPSLQHLTHDVLSRSLQIIGAHAMNAPSIADKHQWWTNEHMTELFFAYLRRGQMRVSDLITHRYPPQQAPDAYDMLLTERTGAMGVILEWPL